LLSTATGSGAGLAEVPITKALSKRPIEVKGKSGEALGTVRTMWRGEAPVPTNGMAYHLINGGYTFPDGAYMKRGRLGLSEQKMDGGMISQRQRQAYEELGPDLYRIDSFNSRDLGTAIVLP